MLKPSIFLPSIDFQKYVERASKRAQSAALSTDDALSLVRPRVMPPSVRRLAKFPADSMLSSFYLALSRTDERTIRIVAARFGIGEKPKKLAEIGNREFMSSGDVRARILYFVKSIVRCGGWS